MPHYRQEVSLITALPAMSAMYGRALVDTLHERVGEEELLRQRADLPPDDDTGLNGAWVRLLAHDGEREGGSQGIYGRGGPGYDYRFVALQVGLDLYRAVDEDDNSRDHAGAYLAYGRGKAEVRHRLPALADFDAGTDHLEAQTIGGYWTRFSEEGAYFDAVAQYTWYRLRSMSYRLPEVSTDGTGLALSLEGGYPFVVAEDEEAWHPEDGRWRLEPQAQVIFQRLSLDDMHDPAGDVRFSDTDSLVARIGARLDRTGVRKNDEDQLRTSDAWLRANIWHEFKGKPRTEFATASGAVPFVASLGGTWYEIGLGGTRQVSDTGYLYADIDYSFSADGRDTAWNGKIGMRWHW